jgi:NAD(P)-dependent dehydrogenase (short-subunit alcohol dehydrogenase family)
VDLHLKDKVALITGASSQMGYGKGIALLLRRESTALSWPPVITNRTIANHCAGAPLSHNQKEKVVCQL